MSKQLSIVIPLYNEEENIPALLEGLGRISAALDAPHEWVLVDNGSRDATARLLDEAAAGSDRLRIVKVEENQGYGWGIISGLRQATGGVVGYLDGDLQVPPEDVPGMLGKVLETGAPLVVARRMNRGDGVLRKIQSIVFNLLFRLLFGVRVSDVNGKPKFMSRELYEQMGLESRDWFIDAEILIKAARLGVQASEYDVHFLKREHGASHVNAGTVFEFLGNMLNYRLGRAGQLPAAQTKQRAEQS
ncbi:MAG: glycosyltransferase family 2 protein [Chrysiogenetes bacterium]|nr:glycosyltransferase family 2 protein [Chrysiogenetes bacterium]